MTKRIQPLLRNIVYGASALVIGVSTAFADERPNVVVILADDLGYSDLGCYGSEISTPHLDRLAAEGTKFINFRASAVCSPTRAMLLTGVDNHLNGFGNMYPFIDPAQEGKPGYESRLNPNAVTLATYLKDAGYHTYMAGKWNIGNTKQGLPSKRGFEHTFALMETGASNWQRKSYLPIDDNAHFFKNGEPFDSFPDDYFSTDFYTDTIIEDIERDRADGKPFFAYLPYQAVHIPIQAPKEYIDKHASNYDEGWEFVRKARHAAMEKMGIVPKGLTLPDLPDVRDWEALDAESQAIESRQMAVFAAMVDNMDHNIGRLIAYLKSIGEYENTIIVFLSDNGAENGDPITAMGAYYAQRFDLSLENMGLKNSAVAYGSEWANVSNTPLNWYKRYAGEGGFRVPFIVRYPKGAKAGVTTDAFTSVLDLVPTILDYAGVAKPGKEYGGREIAPIRGKSLRALLSGESDLVYGNDETFCYELCGDVAVYRGDYKLVRHMPPLGDRSWHLYNIANDLTELNDEINDKPDIRNELLAAYQEYSREVGLIEVADDYDPISAFANRARAKIMERRRKENANKQ